MLIIFSMRGPSHGERRRKQILAAAMDLGSAEGLAGLSLARLADEIGMSKSGLFAHFGSKETLQLAAINAAAAEFEGAVLSSVGDTEPGLARLRALLGAWIDYVESLEFRGGCFFFATSAEFGSRPGPVRERLAALNRTWLQELERQGRVAVRQHELRADARPEQLAFQLHALVQEANWAQQLLDDGDAFAKARNTIERTLHDAQPEETA